ncbi:MAG TPA: MerR family transcriptional regulator [Candidatus Binataceae bacterium]|nr:MerR family transcriptional regulator [Candidatus Binataceae bacterium]
MSSAARTARPSPRKTPRPQGAGGGGGEQLLKIGEAAKAIGVEAYVLRFWETQFPFLRPRHTHSKHRFYAAQDLQTLRLIKRLLHEERFTIEGAKKYIREVGLERALSAKPGAAAAQLEASGAARPAPADSTAGSASASGASNDRTRRAMAEVRRELESLHKLLEH